MKGLDRLDKEAPAGSHATGRKAGSPFTGPRRLGEVHSP